MTKLALAYLAGAGTVTGFVVWTGGTNATLFMLGCITAAVVIGLVCRAIGAARLARWFAAVSSDRDAQPARAMRPAPRPVAISSRPRRAPSAHRELTAVEHDVVLALVGLNCPQGKSTAAVIEAAKTTPQDFEKLFRVANTLAIRRTA